MCERPAGLRGCFPPLLPGGLAWEPLLEPEPHIRSSSSFSTGECKDDHIAGLFCLKPVSSRGRRLDLPIQTVVQDLIRSGRRIVGLGMPIMRRTNDGHTPGKRQRVTQVWGMGENVPPLQAGRPRSAVGSNERSGLGGGNGQDGSIGGSVKTHRLFHRQLPHVSQQQQQRHSYHSGTILANLAGKSIKMRLFRERCDDFAGEGLGHPGRL